MNSTEKVILIESLNKSSKNENMSLNTALSGNKKLLPEDGIDSIINIYDEYVKERTNSNKFRLIIDISPFCSNVLFNPFTEIVKYDKDKITLLNYFLGQGLNVENTIGKGDDFKWTAYDAIRDTQLSNSNQGFEYYCGIDIFNNHILRNKTFKSLNYSKISESGICSYEEVYGEIGYKDRYIQETTTNSYSYLINKDFNTIDDYMRDKNGIIVSDYKLITNNSINEPSHETRIPLHLYQAWDVYSFEDCIKRKLIEKNGWFGFSNPSILNTLSYEETDEETVSSTLFSVSPSDIILDCDQGDIEKQLNIELKKVSSKNQRGKLQNINKTINNRKYCDFIDMYPTRDLFSFSPLYNNLQKRYEKNWNYCLTYPSKSITEDFAGKKFSFFAYHDDGSISLNAVAFDEYTVDDDGRRLVTIYSICQHGLKEGDKVNVYINNGEIKTKDIVYNNGTVAKVIDKYIFQIIKDSSNISEKWINVNEIEWNNEGKATIDGIVYTYDKSTNTVSDDEHHYFKITESNRCNIDPNAQKISFKRVFKNVECDYYVRVFSRLPNFKFTDAEINDYSLYQSDLDLINRFSDPSDTKCDFENHTSDLSFAQTSYGDNDTEIVYTDDVDVSFLKDNLGRPLSEIYFTIIKNNKGYNEWYTAENGIINNPEKIEFSHCFGYISSSFLFNTYYMYYDTHEIGHNEVKDVREICANERAGLIYNNSKGQNDEIIFNEVRDFYGDICCYCPVECDEHSLGGSMARFNTVQREFSYYDLNQRFKILFNSLSEDTEDGKQGVMFHDEIINDESELLGTSQESAEIINDLWKSFNDDNKKLYHSSFALKKTDAKKEGYKYKNMLMLSEGYYYKMHYKIPLKTVSMSISKDNGITYDIFSIDTGETETLKIKTIYENSLSINDKLTLYNRANNKFYYLTVSKIFTKFYFECTVKNEDLSTGFKDDIGSFEDVFLIKRRSGTPEYAKLIKDGSCTYYWRNIIANGIEQNDSEAYPFTNGAFYINKQINFFLRRQDPDKYNIGTPLSDQVNYVPDGEFLPDDFYDNEYYDSEEIETC